MKKYRALLAIMVALVILLASVVAEAEKHPDGSAVSAFSGKNGILSENNDDAPNESAAPVIINTELPNKTTAEKNEVQAQRGNALQTLTFILAILHLLLLGAITFFTIKQYFPSKKKERMLFKQTEALAKIDNGAIAKIDNKVALMIDSLYALEWKMKDVQTQVTNLNKMANVSRQTTPAVDPLQNPPQVQHVPVADEPSETERRLLVIINSKLVNENQLSVEMLGEFFIGCELIKVSLNGSAGDNLYIPSHDTTAYVVIESNNECYLLARDLRCGVQNDKYSNVYEGISEFANHMDRLPQVKMEGDMYKISKKGKVSKI